MAKEKIKDTPDMEIIQVPIEKIIPAKYNPRIITDKEIQEIDDSIDEFGMVEPGVINMHPSREYHLVGGHQRLKRWKLRGHTTFPCVIVRIADEQKEKELNIRLNKAGGSFDQRLLAEYFKPDDLLAWGFEEKELGIRGMSNMEYEEEKEELNPFKQSHILLSFPPELLPDIQEHLEKIIAIKGVEYEQAAN